MKLGGPRTNFVLRALLRHERLTVGSELRRESRTETPAPTGVERQRLEHLVGDADAWESGDVALSIVRVVIELVVLLREAFESHAGKHLEFRQQRDLILEITAVSP